MVVIIGGAVLLTALALRAQQPAAPVEHFEKFIMAGPQEAAGAPLTMSFIAADIGPGGKVVTKAPYTADAVTETVQALADGNRIVQKTTAKLARDGEGRTLRHDTLAGVGPFAAEKPHEVIFINDPVAGVNWVLDAASRTARKLVVTRKGGAAAQAVVITRDGGATAPHAGAVYIQEERKVVAGQADVVKHVRVAPQEMKTESLGKRAIEGLECDGTKSTFTIPAGQLGNERPIEVVSERWFSPELQMAIYSRHSDPRMGETTYQLTNIQRGEPSRLLFDVPPDYKVTDGKALINTVVHESKE